MSNIDPDIQPYLDAIHARLDALESGNPPPSSPGNGMVLYAIIEDRKASGTGGGSVPAWMAGTWFKRTLNTVLYGTVSLAADLKGFTLPAGTYVIEWSAPAHNVQLHKTRLMQGTTVVLNGPSENAGGDHNNYRSTSRSAAMAVVTLTEPATFHVEHIVENANTTAYALGKAAGVGAELFTWVRVYTI